MRKDSPCYMCGTQRCYPEHCEAFGKFLKKLENKKKNDRKKIQPNSKN